MHHTLARCDLSKYTLLAAHLRFVVMLKISRSGLEKPGSNLKSTRFVLAFCCPNVLLWKRALNLIVLSFASKDKTYPFLKKRSFSLCFQPQWLWLLLILLLWRGWVMYHSLLLHSHSKFLSLLGNGAILESKKRSLSNLLFLNSLFGRLGSSRSRSLGSLSMSIVRGIQVDSVYL